MNKKIVFLVVTVAIALIALLNNNLTGHTVGIETGAGSAPPIFIHIGPDSGYSSPVFENELIVSARDPEGQDLTVRFYDSSDNLLNTTTMASGNRVTYTWPDLYYDTTYEWYVTITDTDGQSTTSGRYLFTTPSYVIEDDSVYVESAYAQIKVTPAAAVKSNGKYEQTFEVTNRKNAAGDLCLAYVFDKPITSGKVWLDTGSWTDVTSHFASVAYAGKRIYYPDTSLAFDPYAVHQWKINYAPAADEGDNKYELYLWGKTSGTCLEALQDAGKRSFLTMLDPWWTHEYTWIAVGDGNWADQQNWNDGISGYPDGTDDAAVFNSSSVKNCNVDADIIIGGVDVQATYSGTITQNGNVLVSAAGGGGGFTISGGTWTANTKTLSVAGAVTISGGILTGSTNSISMGSLSITSGTYTATSGTTTIDGSLTNTGGTFTHNNGLVDLIGTGNLKGVTLYDLKLGYPGETVTLTANGVVTNSISYMGGIVTGTANYRLSISNSNANSISIVDGTTYSNHYILWNLLTVIDANLPASQFYPTMWLLSTTSGTSRFIMLGDVKVNGNLVIYGQTSALRKPTVVTGANTLEVTGDLTVGLTATATGYVNADGGTVIVGTDLEVFDSTSVITPGTSSWEFDGGIAQNLKLSSSSLGDVDITSGSSVTMQDDASLNSLAVTLGSLNTNTFDLTVPNDVDVTGTLTGSTGTHAFGSLTINLGGTYSATTGTTTITSETAGGYAFNNDGTLTANSGTLTFTYAGTTLIDSVGTAGNPYNMILNNAALQMFRDTALTVDNDLTLTAGELDSILNLAFTVTGDVDISDYLGANDATVSLGTLTIHNGGTYDAYTSQTTTGDVNIEAGGVFGMSSGAYLIGSGNPTKITNAGTWTWDDCTLENLNFQQDIITDGAADIIQIVDNVTCDTLNISNTDYVFVDTDVNLTVEGDLNINGELELDNGEVYLGLTANDSNSIFVYGTLTSNSGAIIKPVNTAYYYNIYAPTSSTVDINATKITNLHTDGFRITTDEAVINYTNFTNCADEAINITGNSTLVENSNFTDVKGNYAIYVYSGYYNNFTNNTFTGINGYFLRSGSDNVITARNSEQVYVAAAGISGNVAGVTLDDYSGTISGPSGYYVVVGNYFNLSSNTGAAWADIEINYTDAEVDALDIEENTMTIWEWDGSSWTQLTSTTVDETLNVVSGNITSFSIFAAGGSTPSSSTSTSSSSPRGSNSESNERMSIENNVAVGVERPYVVAPEINIELYDSSKHTVKIANINRDAQEVTFTIRSEPQSVTLKINDTQSVDINNNSFYDTNLTLRSILSTDRVRLDIMGLNDTVPVTRANLFTGNILADDLDKSDLMSFGSFLDLGVAVVMFIALGVLVNLLWKKSKSVSLEMEEERRDE